MKVPPINLANSYKNIALKKTMSNSISFKGKEESKLTPYQVKKEFEKIGVEAQILLDGSIELSSYTPDKWMIKSLKEDENELFKHVTSIRGYANFENSKLTSTHALESVGKSVYFGFSNIEEIPNLKYVGKDAYFNCSKIKNVGYMRIGRDAHFEESKVLDSSKVSYGRYKHI